MYTEKIENIKNQIEIEENLPRNISRPKSNPKISDQDFKYLLT